MDRDRKKQTLPPRPRTTRRSIPAQTQRAATKTAEPATSTRSTIRDLSAVIAELPETARGQLSIPGVRGISVDVVSGSIEPKGRARRRTNTVDVELVMATKQKITVRVAGEAITLEREPALALAAIIARVFG